MEEEEEEVGRSQWTPTVPKWEPTGEVQNQRRPETTVRVKLFTHVSAWKVLRGSL